MSRFETIELMPFAPTDLHALVSDVAAYPRFLPWIKATRLSQERPTPNGRYFVGEAIVGYKGFRAQFSTHVQIDAVAQTVATQLIKGPFRTLSCLWEFRPSVSGTLVGLTLEFEFSEPFLSALLASNMDKAVSKLIKAFTEEAQKRYTPIAN